MAATAEIQIYKNLQQKSGAKILWKRALNALTVHVFFYWDRAANSVAHGYRIKCPYSLTGIR